MTFITDTPILRVMMNGLDSMVRTTMCAAYRESLGTHSVVSDRHSSTVPNQDNRNCRYGYQIMAADAIGSSGNLLFYPDIYP